MAYGMVRLLGTAANDVTNARSEGASTGDVSSISIGFWTKAIKAALNLLGSSPGWLFALLAAVIVTEIIFEFSNGLGSMARFAGRNPEAALTIGAVMMLTVAYALALFIANVIRGILDANIQQAASTPMLRIPAKVRSGRVPDTCSVKDVACIWTEARDCDRHSGNFGFGRVFQLFHRAACFETVRLYSPKR